MAWYTTIYPAANFDMNEPRDVIQKKIKEYQDKIDGIWLTINGLCTSTPNDLDEIITKTRNSLDAYIMYCGIVKLNIMYLRLIDDKAEFGEDNEDYRPALDYNHFEYSNDPVQGLSDCDSSLEYIKQKIMGYACATPKDIFANIDEDDGVFDAAEYILHELRDLREFLDNTIYDRLFCELLDKYWDTHTEG